MLFVSHQKKKAEADAEEEELGWRHYCVERVLGCLKNVYLMQLSITSTVGFFAWSPSP